MRAGGVTERRIGARVNPGQQLPLDLLVRCSRVLTPEVHPHHALGETIELEGHFHARADVLLLGGAHSAILWPRACKRADTRRPPCSSPSPAVSARGSPNAS